MKKDVVALGELLIDFTGSGDSNQGNPATIETTGAGDTFCACGIDYIHRKGLDNLTKDGLFECLSFANAAASIITTRKGALSVMPTQEEITAFLTNK